MTTLFKLSLQFALAVAALFSATHAGATDLVKAPIQTDGQAKPNVVFGMDDSGSMDFEVLLNGTSDGQLWWDSASKTAWDKNGKPLFDGANDGVAGQSMAYLFPDGCSGSPGASSALRMYCDNYGVYAVPPTAQFASVRAAAYNPLYYDPKISYSAWLPATIGSTYTTFVDAVPATALAHPLFTSPTVNLQAQQASQAGNWTFNMLPGMVVPAGAQYLKGGSWTNVPSGFTVPAGQTYTANVPYWPASYWNKEACTVDGSTCVKTPDGAGTLKLYEIRATNTTYPTGRTYAGELQNFANWFQYFRKRRLMLGGAMGQVLNNLSGMRLGLTRFNGLSPVTMYDTDTGSSATNGKVIAGMFYSNPGWNGTPTRETLKYIGDQFTTNKSIIQYSCQRNAAFIVTDGFANATSVTPPSYDPNLYGKGAPYQTTYAKTLSDIALSYYTNNVRSDLQTGRVPAALESLDPAADKNSNLHMNTYAITLNASGNLWPANTNAYTNPVTWVNPSSAGHDPTAIDDLWHATINGRGSMFLATNPKDTAQNVQAALTQILRLSGSQSGVTYSTVNLRAGDSFAYAGSYKFIGWSGDLEAFTVNPQTGSLASTSNWSANNMLVKKDWTTRKLATFSGGNGVSLNMASTGAVATQVNYLRGDRSLEGTTYRQRTGLLGAVINADAAVSAVDGVVFGATNEGFLHAFDMTTGNELWGYAPSFVISAMNASASPGWTFATILDGTPVRGTAGGKKILVGGRGTAGSGYYALDITNPKVNSTEADVAARALWEFPGSSTPANVVSALGTSVGRPVLVNTKQWGDVVLVTSGYNSTLDGKGRLFVLDAASGALKYTFVTTVGSVGSADAGFAQVSAWQESDGTVQYVYGGDEQGNLWRFDLVNNSLMKIATLTNAAGASLPITDAPELSNVGNRRMVFVGTGRLLGTTDLDDNKVYSFFGIWDNNSALTTPRTNLAGRAITVNADGTRSVTGTAVNWTTQRGWYVDLPAGEKVNTDPAVAYGALAFTTNKASATACISSSALYLAASASGLQLPDTAFATTPYYGLAYPTTLASRPSVARTSSGKVVVTSRQSDGTTNSRLLNLAGSLPPQKTSWREVLR